MKFGLPISFAAHAVFGLAGLIVFGSNVAPAPQARIIPVELFTVADITNVRAAIKREDIEPPQTDIAPSDPEPVIPAPSPEEPKLAEPDPEPAPAQIETPEPMPQELAEIDLPDEPEPAPDPEPAAPKPLSLDDLQKMADMAKTNAPDTSEDTLLTNEKNRIEQAAENRAQIGAGTGLSTSYEDAIMRKVYQNWQIPAGAPNMENLVVKVSVTLARDGRVEVAAISPDSRARMGGDSFYTAAAESALRAVNAAARFNFLPREQYETWRDLTLTFYPKDAPSIVPT